MIVLQCPGQGTQRPDMLAPWYEGATAVWPAFAKLSEEVPGLAESLPEPGSAAPPRGSSPESVPSASALNYDAEPAPPALDLLPEELLSDTASLQPLLVYTGLASLLAAGLLRPAGDASGTFLEPTRPDLTTAGHSLGYLTALAVAGALTPAEALRLARARGAAMAEAGREHPGAMLALLGGDATELRVSLEAAGLVAANINGPAQLVAAGPLEALNAYTPRAGVRALRLPVAGAFHSPAMASAEEAIRPLVAELAATAYAEERRLTLSLIDDATGTGHPSGTPATPLIEAVAPKITQPVDWLAVQQTIATQAAGATAQPWLLVEAAPAGTLTNLAKRGMRWKHTLALRSAKDLPALPPLP